VLRAAQTTQALALVSLGVVGCAPGPVSPTRAPQDAHAVVDRGTSGRAHSDLRTQWPPPMEHAKGSVAVLEIPRDRSALTELVAALFEAVCQESSDALAELTTEDATTTAGGDPGAPARAAWARRFSTLDYLGLEPTFIARQERIRVYAAADVAQLSSADAVHLTPTDPTQYVITVPINSNDELARLFGAELELLVDWAGPYPQIARFYEEFKLR
jgi:ketosteroid isomerase-like protein